MTLQTVGSIVGIGSGLNSIFGKKGGQSGNTYVPTDQQGADQGWQQFMTQMEQLMTANGGQFSPAIMNAFQTQLGMQPTVQGAGNVAGQQSIANSNLAQLYQTILQGKAGQAGQAQTDMYGAGNQLWQTALDPQNALRDKLAGQTQDRSRLADSTRGIAMGSASAGNENDAMRNFMMDWENQQLQRQATGLQGMGQAYGQAANQGNLQGRDLTGSMDFSAMAPQFAMQGAMYPYQAAGMPVQGAQQAGNAMGSSVYGPMGNFMNQMLAYMGQGQGASGQAFGQQQTGLNNLSTGLGQMGNYMPQLAQLFSGGGQPTGGQPNYAGPDNYTPYTG